MAKRKAKRKAKTVESVVTEKRIEALKPGEIKIGMSTLFEMNKRTAQLIDLVYSLETRIKDLQAQKG